MLLELQDETAASEETSRGACCSWRVEAMIDPIGMNADYLEISSAEF
jgi:hypothetical protein